MSTQAERIVNTQIKRINVGVVGATGVVGETFIALLQERKFPVGDLKLFASDASLGMTRTLNAIEYPINVLQDSCFQGLDIVFFSAGEEISKKWAPIAVANGAYAVDNSSAFRMDEAFDLVVPEVNGDLLLKNAAKPTIIVNPNCSTIQLVVALAPLQKKYGIESVRVASYQSVSGAGRDGMSELVENTSHELTRLRDDSSNSGSISATAKIFPKNIAFNSIPQIGDFDDSGFCGEERKIIFESKKILRQMELRISAFTVRVPTLNSHAEAVWVTLKKKDLSQHEIELCLAEAAGIEVLSLNSPEKYPTPSFASGKDAVYIGRIHSEFESRDTWMMWVVADNLRKGAALNGIQIAEQLFGL